MLHRVVCPAVQIGRQAAIVNYLVYRGLVDHEVRVPLLMALLPGVPRRETVRGPSVQSLSDFVRSRSRRGRMLRRRRGLLHRHSSSSRRYG
jgi:hypothetical protein